jgi:hypothetical protein|tara:strand:- start:389 stop:589 length:201 start_codon:yes stop_codon:yes gene_type:complete
MEQTEISKKMNGQGRSPRRNLAVDDETFQVLENICDERGWTKIEALKRLITKEQKLIKNENQRSRP